MQAGRGQLIWALVALTIAMAIVPLFLVTYPPLQDLPNHLARIVVLTAPPKHAIHKFYEIRWGIIPNLSLDLILIALGTIMPLALASKLVVGLCMAGWVVAPMVLHYAVFKQLSALPLIGTLFLFNQVLRFGLLNFMFGSVLVALALATWILLEDRPLRTRIVVAIAMAVVLFFTHLLISAIFIIAVGIWELLRPRSSAPPIADRIALLAAVMLPALLLYVVSPHETFNNAPPSYNIGQFWPDFFASKAGRMASFVPAGPARGLLFMYIFAGIGIWSARTASSRRDSRLALICLAVFLSFLVMPFAMMDGQNLDWRLLAPFVLFTSASLSFDLKRLPAIALAAVFVVSMASQITSNVRIWTAGESNYRDYAVATSSLPAGSRLFHALIGIREGVVPNAPPILHLPDLAVLERGAAVVSFFAIPTQQPIRLRDGLRERYASVGAGSRLTVDDVDWPTVRRDFDYVLLSTLEPVSPPPDIIEVKTAGYFHLYRVTH